MEKIFENFTVANENFDDNDAVYIYSLETGEFKTLSQTK